MNPTDEPGEVDFFTNLDTRQQDVNFNHTSDQGSDVTEDESARLNAAQGKIVGPGIVLKVSPGDKVDMEVFAKYLDEGQDYESRVASTSTALFGAFTKGLTESKKQVVGNALAGLPQVLLDDDNSAPRAYLNYIFFNKSYTFKLDQSGAKEITTAANGAFEKLELNKEIEEEGYLYIYVANESAVDVNVFFDDLKVIHTETLVKSFTDYYPFGYTIAGLSGESAGTNPNRYLYNGKELQDDAFNGVSLGMYDYGARMYDPILGRLSTQDRFSEKYLDLSPYQYVANSPIINIDINGDSINVSRILSSQNGVQTVANMLLELSDISGLNLSVNKTGMLTYSKTDGGAAEVIEEDNWQKGSVTARNTLIDGMDNSKQTVNVGISDGKGSKAGGDEIWLDRTQINTFVSGTSSELNPKTLGLGMTLIHEYHHTDLGGALTDPPLDKQGQTGPTVDKMNVIRKELDENYLNQTIGYKPYGQRAQYHGQIKGKGKQIPFKNGHNISIP